MTNKEAEMTNKEAGMTKDGSNKFDTKDNR